MSYKIESPLPVVEGGTGKKSLTSYAVLCGGVSATDEIQSIASTGTAGYVLTSNGGGALPTFQNVSASGAISSIDADTGTVTPVAGVIQVLAGVSTQNCGSSVLFDGLADTLELNVTDALNNTIIGKTSGNATLTGDENTVLGVDSGAALTTGNNNTFIGNDVGRLVTIGVNNVMVGNLAGTQLTTGGINTLVGTLAGYNYTGNEFGNICIGYSVEGTVAETNTLRIGNGTGVGAGGEIAQTFISGIDGVDVGSVATVVTEAGNQLGTAVITAGTGITVTPGANAITIAVDGSGVVETITGDTGGALSPVAGNINILAGVSTQNCGSSVLFDGLADTLELSVTDVLNNTIIGKNSGNATLSGDENIILGAGSGIALTTGNNNTIIGNDAATLLTIGVNGVMIGNLAGTQLTTGGANTLVGTLAGYNYTGNENNNILIGYSVEGTVGETNTLRIGNGTGSTPDGAIAQTFISGIDGVDVGSVATVVTEANDQLGTAVLTAGTGITITPGANTITIDATGAMGIIDIAGDTGGAQSGPSIDLEANATAGSSVSFSGAANTISLNVTDANYNTIIGNIAGNGSITGQFNVALGRGNGASLTTGGGNTLVGSSNGDTLVDGSRNVFLGNSVGYNYISETDNILIGNNIGGIGSEVSTLRIGNTTGTGNGGIQQAFICGIDGVNVGSVATVVTEASDQLGTAVITAGTGISVTPGANTITIATSGVLTSIAGDTGGAQSGPAITLDANPSAGSSVSFSGSANTISLNTSDANSNTIIGLGAGNGSIAGSYNTVFGRGSAAALTNATDNVMLGGTVGANITTGTKNVLIGQGAGNAYTSSEGSNILIGASVVGTIAESNVLRIGVGTGTSAGQLNQSFIQGIRGITTVNNDAVAVLIDSAGQLGTVSSSEKLKNNIQDMGNDSSEIMNLRPVTFAYNSDETHKKQYGLIAEEVEKIFPDIVVRNKDGEVETVQYHILPVLLLNEIQKLNARIAVLEAR